MMNRSEILRRLSVIFRSDFMSLIPFKSLVVGLARDRAMGHFLQPLCPSAPTPPVCIQPRLQAAFFGPFRFPAVAGALALQFRNTFRRLRATRCSATAGFVLGLLSALSPASAQDVLPKHPEGETRKVQQISEQLLRPPAPQVMMDGFADLRAWLRDGVIKPSPAAKMLGDSTGALCVTLRYGGRVVGRSVEIGGPDALERAAANVLKDLKSFFGEQLRGEQADRIVISLEAAGALIPYQPSSWDAADLEIPAGIEGVGARWGEGDQQRLRLVFPSMMLTFGHGSEKSVGTGGQAPGDALASCAANVLQDPSVGLRADPASDPVKLARDRKVMFYRFDVSQLAQINPVEAPVFLYRHGRVVQEKDINSAVMRTWADGLAQHLLNRVAVHDKGALVSGLYSPVSGACVPRAEIGEEALIGLALARGAESGVLAPDIANRSREGARAILRDLAARDEAKRRVESSPIAAAAYLLTLRTLGVESPELKEATTAASKAVRAELEGTVRSPSVYALALWAASSDASLQELAQQSLPKLFRAVPVEKLAAAMPWAVVAARTISTGEDIPSAGMFGEWRELVFKFVLRPQDAGSDGEDLVGGMVFTGAKSPLPSAQSLRVIGGLAALINDDRLTPPPERGKEIARLLPSLRFVRQLMGDEYNGTMFVDPLRAEWGIRNAMWDQRMSGEASALGLITLCEAIEGTQRGH